MERPGTERPRLDCRIARKGKRLRRGCYHLIRCLVAATTLCVVVAADERCDSNVTGHPRAVRQRGVEPDSHRVADTLPERARRLRRPVIVNATVSPLTAAPDVRWLVRASDLVIIGTPIRADSALTPDEMSIQTRYDISVQVILDGPTEAGKERTISLSFPGGRVDLGAGLAAEVRTPALPRLKVRGEYVLFLQEISKEDPLRTVTPAASGTSEQRLYRLTLGAQSVFLLQGGRVTIQLPDTYPLASYNDMPRQRFIDELRELAGRGSRLIADARAVRDWGTTSHDY